MEQGRAGPVGPGHQPGTLVVVVADQEKEFTGVRDSTVEQSGVKKSYHSMLSITNEITIAATPEDVWLALVDFPRWENWNPFLRDLEGVALAGERVKVTVNPDYAALHARLHDLYPDRQLSEGVVLNKSSSFRPRITHYQPAALLGWKYHNLLTGGYRQRFALQHEKTGGTKFFNTVAMTGCLPRLGWETAIKPMYDGGMQLMNEGLKHWVEQGREAFDPALFALRR